MSLEKSQEKKDWYNNASTITWLLIIIISVIIVSSQSFSINREISAIKMFQNVLNHNITYMIALVYFISLKTKTGKKYFDYSSLIMLIIFFLTFVTSILTIFQSFGLTTLLSCSLNALIFIYFFHTFLRGTILWKDFKLKESPFNELTNEWYFRGIVIVEIILYTVSLISSTTLNGVVLATFDCIYIILLAKFVYLYGAFLDKKKKNINNNGNFDEYREKVIEIKDNFSEKSEKIIDEAKEVSDKLVEEVKNKSNEVISEVKSKSNKAIDEVKSKSKSKKGAK